MLALAPQPFVADLPSFSRYLREIVRFPGKFRGRPDRVAAAGRDGGGRAVLVIPGFLAHDWMTRRLRNTLALANYRPHAWELGINWGARPDLIDRMVARFDAIRVDDEPVALVGWSLGGLYARELAKRRPEAVERVVTLGTPFSGDPRGNRAWRMYELINQHAVDDPPFPVERTVKPPAPTFALWSPVDGIVAPSSARGAPGEVDRSVEVRCRHMGFISERPALTALLDVLEAAA